LSHPDASTGGIDASDFAGVIETKLDTDGEFAMPQVPQLMGEVPEPLAPACRLPIDAGLISFTSVLRHRAGDGIVKALGSDQHVTSSVLRR
jgi:hypothetical protein